MRHGYARRAMARRAGRRLHALRLYRVQLAFMTRRDGFDPVGIAEIAAMTDPPMSKQLARYIMDRSVHPDAPEPVPLARMKVWRAREVAPYLLSTGRKMTG